MGLGSKPSYEHTDHDSLLKFIHSSLPGYQKKEMKRRSSKNTKFGN